MLSLPLGRVDDRPDVQSIHEKHLQFFNVLPSTVLPNKFSAWLAGITFNQVFFKLLKFFL
jgi:hypothetical protein